MENTGGIVQQIHSTYGFWCIILSAAAVVLLAVQLYYHVGYYGTLGRRYLRKKRDGQDGAPAPVLATGGISVIVLTGDDYWYLDHTVPKVLAQEYPDFELVIVEVGTTEDFTDRLTVLREQYPRLTVTRVDNDPRFPISNKIAYNLGIKAARYDNIILTTSEAYPVSPKWLGCMAEGFRRGDIVIGYCGLEKNGTAQGRRARSSRLFSSVRYLSSALRGRPYRGIIQNLGFTREAYFQNRGFDYLNMNIGEDDLFVQRLGKTVRAAVVVSPHATVRQKQWGGRAWWWDKRKYYDVATRYYPAWIRLHVAAEVLTRLAFYAAVAAMIAICPPELKIAAGVLFLVRTVAVRYTLWRSRRVLGEPGLGNSSMVYDLYYPFSRIWLSVMGRLRPAPGVWR
ncbi:MAG: glycosyltransferase [Rikenellaceae bacterium]|nr:glycosyltransferase [Rikenellaceae bacterium]